jgi:lysophospholipase L1-like esterase
LKPFRLQEFLAGPGSKQDYIERISVSKIKTVVFSLFPALLLLIILEITGRIIYPFDPDKRALIKTERDPHVELSYVSSEGNGKTIFYDIHRKKTRYLPFLGWIGEPNTDLSTIKTNELGFRDKPLLPRKDNEYRILILGGSTAWGLGASSNEKTVAGALESQLNRSSDNYSYRVMNGAYPGWQSRQELTTLMEFYDEFDPDLIIAVTGWNDVYVLTEGEDPDLQMRKESGMLAKAVKETLQPMSTMYAVRKLAGSLGIWRLVIHFREKMHLASPPSVRVSYDAENAERIIPGMVDRYLTMANFSKRHGAKLMLAIQPDIYTTGKTLTQEEESVSDRHTSKFVDIEKAYPKYRSDFLDKLREQFIDSEVTVLDLGGVFDDLDDPVFLDHCHFNDMGYQKIASLLHNRINNP